MSDLEIYIKAPVSDIQAWLEAHFDDVAWSSRGRARVAVFDAEEGRGRLTLYPEAFRGFCGVLIESESLPFPDDLSLARTAWEAFSVEVRCTAQDWSEDMDPADEWWWRLDERGEQKVRWN